MNMTMTRYETMMSTCKTRDVARDAMRRTETCYMRALRRDGSGDRAAIASQFDAEARDLWRGYHNA